MKVLLIVVSFCVLLCGCGASVTVDGKTAEEWRATATDLQEQLDLANANLRLAQNESVASAADAVVVDNPCFKFSSTPEGRTKQEKACTAWVSQLREIADQKRDAAFKRSNAAHADAWAKYPTEMTKYVVLQDQARAAFGFEDAQKKEAEIDALLASNPDFAQLMKLREYGSSPEGDLAGEIYRLEDIWKAFSKYLVATGK